MRKQKAAMGRSGGWWAREWGALALGVAVLVGAPERARGQNAKRSARALEEAEAKQLNAEALRLYRDEKLDAAIPLVNRELAILEKALGPEHPDVATSLTNLAVLYNGKGDYARAEPLFQRGFVIREKALGPEHPDVANSLGNLATLYQYSGDYARAEPLYRRALAILEKALGPEHPGVGLSLNNLAVLYEEKGDYAQAEPLHRRALAIKEKALGPEHPDVATSLSNLGSLFHIRGDDAQAESLVRRALAIREKAFGPEHPDVANSLNNLAVLYETKDYAQAEPLYRRALAIREKALGPGHPAVASTLYNLAVLYDEKGDYAQAEPHYRRALAIREKVLGPEHPDVAASLHRLAGLYREKGDYAQAVPLYRRALATRVKALGLEHPDVATSLIDLGVLYYINGELAQAEPLYRRALAIVEKALGPEHRRVAIILNNLALLYATQRDYARAEPLHRRALAISEKALGPEHPLVATSLNNLALLYQTKGDYAPAEPLYRRTLVILEKALGPEHPDVVKPLANLAFLNLVLGDLTEALRRLQRATAVEDHNAAAVLKTGSDEQKRAYMTTLRETTYGAITLHVQFAPNVQRAKRLALATILHRKGRVLDAMADSFAVLRRRTAPAEQADLDRLRSLSSEYSALVWRGPGKTPSSEYRAILARLDEERRAIENDLSRRSAELNTELRPLRIEDVRAAIPKGAALVELFRYNPFNMKSRTFSQTWGKARYVAYILLREGEIQWVDLGEAALIDAAVNALLATLRRPSLDPKPAARALDAMVMQPIRRLLGETRWVFLSPDGALNLVPFAALRDEDDHYLVERYAFTYLTSGRDLVRAKAQSAPQQGPVIVAAPDFGVADAPASAPIETSQRSADMGARSYRLLPGAAEEGRALRRQLSEATLTMGADATESAVKALRGPRLLHIATHGFFLPDQPELRASALDQVGFGAAGSRGGMRAPIYAENPLLRSGLVFAGVNHGKSGKDDGVLTALEAAQLNLDGTKLVVLSACETAVGEAKSGEGVYGLRRALVIAGAETQVMSLWRIDDATTRQQMEDYYDGLLRGGGRSEAMRQVQLAMLNDPQRAHPYYWASFIVSGNPAALDGTPVVPKPPPVSPGARGCCCDVATSARADSGAWAAAIAAFALVCARCRRRQRMPH